MTDTIETEAPPVKRLAFMITGDRVSFILNARPASFHLLTDQGKRMVELLRAEVQDIDAIGELADIRTWIAKQSHGRVVVDEKEQLRLDGKLIDYGLTGRVTKLVEQGLSFVALANFVERLSRNPDPTVAEDLYKFMEKGGIPFDEDGYLYGFKKVDNEYWSYRSGANGKVQYLPGTSPSMPREDCDPNRNVTCSRGLHVCSPAYLNFWYKQQGKVLTVRVDPEHVTAIPADHNDQKLRCCELYVAGEVPEDEAHALFQKVVDNSFAPKPPAPEPEAADPVAEVIGEDGKSALEGYQPIKLHAVDGADDDDGIAEVIAPPATTAEWAKRGYEAGEAQAQVDLDEANDYDPRLDVPVEIAGNVDARAIYSKAFIEAYDATYRAGEEPIDDIDLDIPDHEA